MATLADGACGGATQIATCHKPIRSPVLLDDHCRREDDGLDVAPRWKYAVRQSPAATKFWRPLCGAGIPATKEQEEIDRLNHTWGCVMPSGVLLSKVEKCSRRKSGRRRVRCSRLMDQLAQAYGMNFRAVWIWSQNADRRPSDFGSISQPNGAGSTTKLMQE